MLLMTSVRCCSREVVVGAGGADSERCRSESAEGILGRTGVVMLIAGMLTLDDAEDNNGGVGFPFILSEVPILGLFICKYLQYPQL
jgi:hypothetical protein